MIKIRAYQPADAQSIGLLIAETYGNYNLSYLAVEERGPYLGPFQHTGSADPEHQAAIARIIQAPTLLVAENAQGQVVGVLRGSPERLHSLFTRPDHHRQGIGRMLLTTFEKECEASGGQAIRLAATFYAVPFYQALGYKKSTGVRKGWSFDGPGFKWQPMKKVLK